MKKKKEKKRICIYEAATVILTMIIKGLLVYETVVLILHLESRNSLSFIETCVGNQSRY